MVIVIWTLCVSKSAKYKIIPFAIYQTDIDLVIVLGQTETLREDGTGIRTVGKARPWVLDLIPSLVDRRPNNSGIRI